MIQKTKYIVSLMLAGCFASLPAQEATVLVRDKQVRHIGNELQVEMRFVLDSVEVTRGNSLVCTPIIEEGDSLHALPSLIINGRDRQILYERMERENENEMAVRRLEGKQSVSYKASIPYADWMEQSKVSLIIDDCGCGWEALSQNRSPLFDIDLAPVVLAPAMVYLTPEAEVVKARKMEGSAFLDFPVNKTAIYPEYRKNPEELKKITQTIDAVRGNKFATITHLAIKGYASPEGGYKNNAYLAENRAKALLDYVKGLYDFGDIPMDIDFGKGNRREQSARQGGTARHRPRRRTGGLGCPRMEAEAAQRRRVVPHPLARHLSRLAPFGLRGGLHHPQLHCRGSQGIGIHRPVAAEPQRDVPRSASIRTTRCRTSMQLSRLSIPASSTRHAATSRRQKIARRNSLPKPRSGC